MLFSRSITIASSQRVDVESKIGCGTESLAPPDGFLPQRRATSQWGLYPCLSSAFHSARSFTSGTIHSTSQSVWRRRFNLEHLRILQFLKWGHCSTGAVQKFGLRSGFWKGDILMSSTPVDPPAGLPVKSLDITFMAANAVGIVLYLLLASRGWRIPQEHGMVPVTGEPFVWVLALAVLGAFLLANIVWGGFLLRYRESRRGLLWLITGAMWLLAICVDFAHH